jgi:hypothetical protein
MSISLIRSADVEAFAEGSQGFCDAVFGQR